MGNTASAPNSSTQESIESNITTLPYLIDEIAMHYMLTQNSIDLIRLTDKEYYDNLIILTSNVLEKRLNNLEIGYLKNRIGNKDEQLQDIMPANSKVKDKVVMDISKFYIKIVMIYSAIASTFDPQYSYSDENGSNKSFYLKDFDEYKNIPKNVKPSLVQLTNPISLCRKRLNILKNRYDDSSEPGSVILNPGEKLCSTESTIKLTDEIGIKELDSLYYDIFDYNTKSWSKKSNKMKKKYNKDLILFYRIFTGKRTKPSNIKSFQDIELLDFKTLNSCSDNTFLSDIVISKENKLVKQYKEKIDLIQSSTEDNRNKLYAILKELFVIKIIDNEQSYTINPSLTLDKILLLEEETRNIILDLYISCEKYFIQALIIFENIYESKDYTISEYRKENLMKIEPEKSLNYKDSLTITPPFSPDISLQEKAMFSPITPSPQTDASGSKPGVFDALKNIFVPNTIPIAQKQEPFGVPSNPSEQYKPQPNFQSSSYNSKTPFANPQYSDKQTETKEPMSLFSPNSSKDRYQGETNPQQLDKPQSEIVLNTTQEQVPQSGELTNPTQLTVQPTTFTPEIKNSTEPQAQPLFTPQETFTPEIKNTTEPQPVFTPQETLTPEIKNTGQTFASPEMKNSTQPQGQPQPFFTPQPAFTPQPQSQPIFTPQETLTPEIKNSTQPQNQPQPIFTSQERLTPEIKNSTEPQTQPVFTPQPTLMPEIKNSSEPQPQQVFTPQPTFTPEIKNSTVPPQNPQQNPNPQQI